MLALSQANHRSRLSDSVKNGNALSTVHKYINICRSPRTLLASSFTVCHAKQKEFYNKRRSHDTIRATGEARATASSEHRSRRPHHRSSHTTPTPAPTKEFYNQAPSHDTGHGTGAHWH